MGKIKIMINGLPGNVTRIITKAAMKNDGFHIIPFSLTGPEIEDQYAVVDSHKFKLLKPDSRDNTIEEIKADYITDDIPFIAIDFTHPTAVNSNAEFYCEHHIPFVMGTTGGDRDQLEKTVAVSSISAVIAPNMAKQIVGFQAMMEYAADNFPVLFKDYTLEIVESHQKGKADTSGTAKAMVEYFNKLGPHFKVDEIQMIRDPEVQANDMNIPEEHLKGHGWHTYTLKAKDGSALFEFKHNVNGRDIYANGTFDAVRFLADRIQKEKETVGKVYSMIDVLNRN